MTKYKNSNPWDPIEVRERHEWKQRKRDLWRRIFKELEDSSEVNEQSSEKKEDDK